MNNVNRRLLVAAVFHFVHPVKNTVFIIVSSLCIVFSVFTTVTPSKIKMPTSQYRKSSIWEMKRKINIAKAST